jgi:hypothetical protein
MLHVRNVFVRNDDPSSARRARARDAKLKPAHTVGTGARIFHPESLARSRYDLVQRLRCPRRTLADLGTAFAHGEIVHSDAVVLPGIARLLRECPPCLVDGDDGA